MVISAPCFNTHSKLSGLCEEVQVCSLHDRLFCNSQKCMLIIFQLLLLKLSVQELKRAQDTGNCKLYQFWLEDNACELK